MAIAPSDTISNRKSTATIITSNREEAELHALFGDPLLASAAMDRLLHHAHVLYLEGDTFRNPKSKRARPKSAGPQPPTT